MANVWNKYEPTAARKQARPGREVRPKSLTLDIHSHVAIPQAAPMVKPHLAPAPIPAAGAKAGARGTRGAAEEPHARYPLARRPPAGRRHGQAAPRSGDHPARAF